MTVLAEAMFNEIGFVKDAQGNYNPPPEPVMEMAPAQVPTAAPAAAPRATAPVAPAQAVAPVKATAPQVDIPEPPIIGQPVGAVDATAARKKKSLLGA